MSKAALERPAPGRQHYYATWTGYGAPVRPHNPIDYATAEASRAFSVFVFDDRGRVTSFEKWLVTAAAEDPSTIGESRLPPGRHYFSVRPSGLTALGRQLSLDDTKQEVEYYRVDIGEAGAALVERVRRTRVVRHEYTYWDNDRVRDFRYLTGPDSGGVEHFDRDGKRISQH